MDRELSSGEGKKPYEAPSLTNISLRPEEAVLGHCKTLNGGGGQNAGSCGFFGMCAQNFGS
jgi:hypothetical protein